MILLVARNPKFYNSTAAKSSGKGKMVGKVGGDKIPEKKSDNDWDCRGEFDKEVSEVNIALQHNRL